MTELSRPMRFLDSYLKWDIYSYMDAARRVISGTVFENMVGRNLLTFSIEKVSEYKYMNLQDIIICGV